MTLVILAGAPGRLAGLGLAAMAAALWAIGGLRASRADQAGVAFAVASAVAFSFYLLGSARLVRDTGARPVTRGA